MRFVFLDPGPLIDAELSLIPPDVRYVDDWLLSAAHPLTRRDAPAEANTNRQKQLDFLKTAPGGHQSAEPGSGRLPAYHFWMKVDPVGDPPLTIVGGCNLRIGTNPEIETYTGNIGYAVFPAARGHHYAERACRLMLP